MMDLLMSMRRTTFTSITTKNENSTQQKLLFRKKRSLCMTFQPPKMNFLNLYFLLNHFLTTLFKTI